ncbi:MAG: phosphate ABC transporter substrate-binding protein PstS [Abditibacteriaceae bacterium]
MKIAQFSIIRWGIALVTTATLVAGCTAPQNSLTAAGATFPYPVYAQWFDTYYQKTGVTINSQPMGSGAGVQQIRSRTMDFGASDTPVGDEQLKTMPRKLLQIPTVAGAIVLAYNLPGLKSPLKMDGVILADIYLGKITKWNDPKIIALNPGIVLPNMGIVVGHRSDGSGTSYIFTSYLSDVSPEWAKKVGTGKSVSWPVGIGSKGNSGVAGVIKQSPGALGYVELAYAQQNKFQYAALRNKAGKYVLPTVAATTAAAAGMTEELKKDIRTSIVNAPGEKSYPIAAFTYILVYEDTKNTDKASEIKSFLKWAITKGQEMASPLDYASLPKSVVALDEELIEKIH